MAVFVSKILQTYLQVFLKDKAKLDLSLLQGDLTLHSIQLNEKVVQFLARVPPTLEVISVRVGQLKIHIPWRNLAHSPIMVELEDVDVEIHETQEPLILPPIPKLTKLLGGSTKTKAATTPTPTTSNLSQQQQEKQTRETLESIDKNKKQKKSVSRGLFEDITIQITNINIKVVFLSRVQSKLPITLTLSLAAFLLRTTNSRWEVVDLASARKDGLSTASNEYTLHKELVLGSMQIHLQDSLLQQEKPNKAALIKLQPTSWKVSIKRKIGIKKPIEIIASLSLPMVVIQMDSKMFDFALDAIESLIACLKQQKQQKKKLISKSENQATPTPTPTPIDPAISLQQALFKLASVPVQPSPSSSETSEIPEDNDEFEELGHEYEFEIENEEERNQKPEENLRFDLPVLNLSVNIELISIKLVELAIIDSRHISFSIIFDKAMIPDTILKEKDVDLSQKFVRQTIIKFSIGSFSISSTCIQEVSQIAYVSDGPLITINSVFRSALKNLRPLMELPASETSITISTIHLILNHQFLSSAFLFVSSHRKSNLPIEEPIKQQQQQANSKNFWWLNSSVVQLNIKGIVLLFQIDGINDLLCFGIGKTISRLQPSNDLSALTSLQNIQFDEISSTTSGMTSGRSSPTLSEETRERSNSIASAHSTIDPIQDPLFQELTFSCSDIFVGICNKDEANRRYLLSPFEISGELKLQKPTLIPLAIFWKELDRISQMSEVIPIIDCTIQLSSIHVELSSEIIKAISSILLPFWILKKEFREKKTIAATTIQQQEVISATIIPTKSKRRSRLIHHYGEFPLKAFCSLKVDSTAIIISTTEETIKNIMDIFEISDEQKGFVERLFYSMKEEIHGTIIPLFNCNFDSTELLAIYNPQIYSISPQEDFSSTSTTTLQNTPLELSLNIRGFNVLFNSTTIFPFGFSLIPILSATKESVIPVTNNLRLKYSSENNVIQVSLTGSKCQTNGDPSKLKSLLSTKKKPTQKSKKERTRATFAIDLCDIDFCHCKSITEMIPIISFRITPKQESGILQIREIYSTRLMKIQISQKSELSSYAAKLSKLQIQFDNLERLLVETRLISADLHEKLDHKDQIIAQLENLTSRTNAEIEHLKKENERLFGIIAQSSDVSVHVSDFRQIIEGLSKQVIEEGEKRKLLAKENQQLQELMLRNEQRSQETLEKLQRKQEEDEKITRMEIERLRNEIEEKDKQMKLQEMILIERNALEDKVRKLEEELIEQSEGFRNTQQRNKIQQLKSDFEQQQQQQQQQQQNEETKPSESIAPIQSANVLNPPSTTSGRTIEPLTSPSTSTAQKLKPKKLIAGLGRLRDQLDRGFDRIGQQGKDLVHSIEQHTTTSSAKKK